MAKTNLKTQKDKRSPIFTYYVQFLLAIILVKFFFNWPSGLARKKRKTLYLAKFWLFDENFGKMVAKASCHSPASNKWVSLLLTEIFSVVCSLITQAEKYCCIHAEFDIAWITTKSPRISPTNAKLPYCELWNSKFSKGHLGKFDWPTKLR